jgi:integral membrane protein (TIGR00529 family)
MARFGGAREVGFSSLGMMRLLEPLGLLVSLILIVILVMKRTNYGAALLIGALILALFSSLTPEELFKIFFEALTDPSTWDLALITTLIPILAFCMRKTGMVDGLVASMRASLPARATLAFLPALMGALPMPGGALLSAPLIEDEGKRLRLTREEESFINVWFRHWNFFVYPLSSTLILVSSLSGVSMFTLIKVQFLPLILYLILGYIFSLRGISEYRKDNEARAKEKFRAGELFRSVLLNASPIIISILLNALGLPIVIALLLGITSIFVLKRIEFKGIVRLLVDGFDWKPAFAIIGVMCFRYMVKESGGVEGILPYSEGLGLPPTILLLLITWMIGFTTAMPTAAVAMIFPMAISMMGSMDSILTCILYLTIIFSYIISPMHLCLILTIEYYESQLQKVYRRLIPASLVSYTVSLAIILATFYT